MNSYAVICKHVFRFLICLQLNEMTFLFLKDNMVEILFSHKMFPVLDMTGVPCRQHSLAYILAAYLVQLEVQKPAKI